MFLDTSRSKLPHDNSLRIDIISPKDWTEEQRNKRVGLKLEIGRRKVDLLKGLLIKTSMMRRPMKTPTSE